MGAEDVRNGGYARVGISVSACSAKIILYSSFTLCMFPTYQVKFWSFKRTCLYRIAYISIVHMKIMVTSRLIRAVMLKIESLE